MLDQVLALILFLIVVSSLKRLTMGAKARYTSWGMLILIVNGFFFFRLPQALGWQFFEEYADWERLIAYSIALILNGVDWHNYNEKKRLELVSVKFAEMSPKLQASFLALDQEIYDWEDGKRGAGLLSKNGGGK
jgi:hypothetical protein